MVRALRGTGICKAWKTNSESSGTNPLSGVDGPAPANKVISDGVSKEIVNSASDNFGPGSCIPGSSSSCSPSPGEKKMESSNAFWKTMLVRSGLNYVGK
ncbi:hypothetical protein Taro_020137 [Colocasia esculenta]|uniref:Uncharacterized protein n=1 Tax=Colocasia esculenta TaxID=4460 RepID=A0A843UYS3_COLES|nr:hypothetical protein [Colocasia esculenta]